MKQAIFAAGCFWGVQYYFDQVPGVTKTTVGYTGGHTENPSYEAVCTHTTGHAEAVLLEFDPAKVSYETLCRHFFRMHDPTQLNRQGPDIGSNYRSAVFYHSPEQEAMARASQAREQQEGRHRRTIVTEITPAAVFWPAEEYHQQYLAKRGGGSCRW
jgi:peptide-methionine (S)-S-oxide reductase